VTKAQNKSMSKLIQTDQERLRAWEEQFDEDEERRDAIDEAVWLGDLEEALRLVAEWERWREGADRRDREIQRQYQLRLAQEKSN
tara:strand:+ start:1512 stop:1766 length:255 start_codon:yes stop_codon:yes gene_type:complete